jgi:hypothetical protein
VKKEEEEEKEEEIEDPTTYVFRINPRVF